jgi:hypothetical protein
MCNTNRSWQSLLIVGGGLTLMLATSGAAQAALISTPGLTFFTFWELSGTPSPKFALGASPQMTTQLGALNGSSNDFTGVPSEWYDVFYSDANGAFNVNGNYVTVEARYDNASGGGGLNIGGVDMVIGSTPIRADVLTSWVGLGSNYIAGSEALVVDPSDVGPVPATYTTMGNTANSNGRLRLTVTWSKLVPEPGSCVLAMCGIVGLLGTGRHRWQK